MTILSSCQSQPVALVTGTSSGFGLLISLALAEQGYQVISTMRDLSKQDQLLKEADKKGLRNQLSLLCMDVTSEQSIRSTVKAVIDKFGRIDVLINNAGIAIGGYVEDVSMEQWREQLEVNFFGTVAVTKEVLPYMREQRNGKLVFISSISGRIGFPGLAPYAASKFALEGFAESLRHEASPFGIDTILIEPGSFQTSIWDKSISAVQERMAQSHLKKETARLVKEVRKTAASAGNPMDVIKVLLQSLHAKQPKLRYPVGKGVRLTLAVKSCLPWRFFEKIVRRMLSKD